MVLLLLADLAAGVCAGVFGIGGGVVIVPILVFLFGFNQHAANGTSLVALLLPVGALGVYKYYVDGKITPENIKMGLLIGVGIFVGTYLGAFISIGMSPSVLRKSFAVFLVLVSIRLWFIAK